MPLRRFLAAVAAVAAVLTPARARADDKQRFFVEETASAEAPDATLIDGSLTSTSFYYQEFADLAQPAVAGGTRTRVASPVARLFTDLRAQLTARQIKGSKLGARIDVRGRYVATQVNPDPDSGDPGQQNLERTLPTQGGTFGGREREIRELYLKHHGAELDVYLGRKFSLELAAVKFDGIEIDRRTSDRWTVLGFVGLYPTRGSRDVHDDYPKGLADPTKPEAGTKRVLPVTGGLGGAYRVARAYGAIGGVAIMPLARDQSGKIEEPRVFATANGYFRASQRLDLFHYVVADLRGAAGAGLTNLTLGLGFQPRPSVRLSAQATEVDTETLNVQAQTRLEDPDPGVADQLQNNIEVSRVAQQSARLGLSVALAEGRFEISTSGTLRRRGELSLPATGGGNTTFTFPAAKAADVMLMVVDRRSWKQLRLAASIVKSVGVGGANLDRTRSLVARVEGTREIAAGRAEVEGSLSYLRVTDGNIGVTCDSLLDIETCYGASKVSSINLGGVAYYRFRPAWFLIGSATAGRQRITSTYGTSGAIVQPALLSGSFFFRIAYRF